jgi:hypothetical protein
MDKLRVSDVVLVILVSTDGQRLYTRRQTQAIREGEKTMDKKNATAKRVQFKYTRNTKAVCGKTKRVKTVISEALNA